MATLHSISGDAVAWKEVDGEFVLISVETTHYYSLNSSGSDVWRILLEGPQTADAVAGALATRHGVDAGSVRPEVSDLLTELRSEGLIRIDEGDDPPGFADLAALDGIGAYVRPSLVKYDALERLILSGE